MVPDGSEWGVALAGNRWVSVPSRPLVLVPTGATEQHGPHLPLDTDSLIATAVATEAARRLGGPVLVAPVLSYGASGEHQDFPGTVSIGREALAMVVVELARSLSVWAGRIVFVNAHGGNAATLGRAVARLRGEHHDVAWVPCQHRDGDAHAGRTETSLMLHLVADRVDLVKATPGNTTPIGQLLPQLMEKGVRAVSPSGVLGDPAGASALEGELIFEAIVSDVRHRLADGFIGHDGLLAIAAVGQPS